MQLGLFHERAPAVSIEEALLFALGEFQARGHRLVDRELALDRLRGAFLRAFARFEIPEPDDPDIAAALSLLGAGVVQIPHYFAKRPFRVTVPAALAAEAREVYLRMNGPAS
jgi:hypothetical protein